MNAKLEMTCQRVLNKTIAERNTLNCQMNPNQTACTMYYLDNNNNLVKKIEYANLVYQEQLSKCQVFE